jgi:hypothetical protein
MRKIEERMARMKQSQRPAIPRTATSRSGPAPSKPVIAVLGASILAAVWALTMLTPTGQIFYVYTYFFMEFYIGVVTLVSLSLTVMAGLLATDRIVLLIRHRVLLQSVHRATGIIAVSGLGMHILLKVTEGHAGVIDAFVPFVSGHGVYIGFGTIAAYLMVSVLWTGIIRARFVGVGRPWMWRAMHSTAYVSWPIGLMHGLNAGRPPATWVFLSYLLCVFLVVVALVVRLTVSLGRKRSEQGKTTTSTAIKPVGKMARDDGESRTAGGGASRRRAGGDIMVGREPRKSFRSERIDPLDPVIDPRGRPAEFEPAYSPRRGSDRFVVPEVARAGEAEELAGVSRRSESRRRSAADRPPAEDRLRAEDRDGGRRGSAEDRFAEDRSAIYRARRGADDARPVDSRDDRMEGSRRWAADDRTPADDLRGDYRENYRDSYRETTRETAGARETARTRDRDRGAARDWEDTDRDWEDTDRIRETDRRRGPLVDDRDLGAGDRFRHSADDELPRRGDYGSRSDDYARGADYPRTDDYAPRDADYAPRDADYAPRADYSRRDDYPPRDVDYPPREIAEESRTVARYPVESPPVPVDDTPTLVDLASRRAIRAAAEGGLPSGRLSKRKRAAAADSADEDYWRDLRGEAQ